MTNTDERTAKQQALAMLENAVTNYADGTDFYEHAQIFLCQYVILNSHKKTVRDMWHEHYKTQLNTKGD